MKNSLFNLALDGAEELCASTEYASFFFVTLSIVFAVVTWYIYLYLSWCDFEFVFIMLDNE